MFQEVHKGALVKPLGLHGHALSTESASQNTFSSLLQERACLFVHSNNFHPMFPSSTCKRQPKVGSVGQAVFQLQINLPFLRNPNELLDTAEFPGTLLANHNYCMLSFPSGSGWEAGRSLPNPKHDDQSNCKYEHSLPIHYEKTKLSMLFCIPSLTVTSVPDELGQKTPPTLRWHCRLWERTCLSPKGHS